MGHSFTIRQSHIKKKKKKKKKTFLVLPINLHCNVGLLNQSKSKNLILKELLHINFLKIIIIWGFDCPYSDVGETHNGYTLGSEFSNISVSSQLIIFLWVLIK